MRPKLPVTITDVAEKADVSIATVSRVINDVGTAREDTVKRVWKAIEDVGYKPTPKQNRNTLDNATQSKFRHTHLAFLRIGEFDPDAQSPVTRHLEEAIRKAAESQGHFFTSHSVVDLSSAPARQIVGNAEGLIIRTSNISDLDHDVVAWLDRIPAVRVLGESRTGRHWFDHLGPDNGQVGALAAEYLMGKGCDRLVFASTNVNIRSVGLDRCTSFVKSAEASGVQCQIYFQAHPSEITLVKKSLSHLTAQCYVFGKRHDLIRQLAKENSDRFGLFAPTDLELSTIMPQLEMVGVDFQNRCPVIGCDRELRCFTGLTPQPATMDLLIDNLAERAIRRLLFRMENPDEPLVRMMVSPQLVLPGTLDQL